MLMSKTDQDSYLQVAAILFRIDKISKLYSMLEGYN